MIADLDSSVLACAYLVDEDGHEQATALLADPDIATVTGTWTRIEVSGWELLAVLLVGRGQMESMSDPSGSICRVSDRRLRQWRGVKPVAALTGVAITARLRTSAEDEFVLDQVATHLGRLRRGDLAATSTRAPADPQLGTEQRRQVRRDELNARKRALTAQSSARWANAIIAGNDDQHRLARDAQLPPHHRVAGGDRHHRQTPGRPHR